MISIILSGRGDVLPRSYLSMPPECGSHGLSRAQLRDYTRLWTLPTNWTFVAHDRYRSPPRGVLAPFRAAGEGRGMERAQRHLPGAGTPEREAARGRWRASTGVR